MLDELDLRLAFTQRPEGVNLPELDRLASESIFATNGVSYHEATKRAIPAFLTGRDIKSATPVGPSDLLLEFTDATGNSGPVSFRNQSTLFTEVHEAGRSMAVVGIYHPYCRLFSDLFLGCHDFAMKSALLTATNDLGQEMIAQYRGLTPILAEPVLQVWRYKQVLAISKRFLMVGSHDLLYLHAPVPHAPNIYNRNKRQISVFNFSKQGYLGNLELADRFLGEIRAVMEKNGTWDETAVLVTSDHEWRFVQNYDGVQTHKTPFLLKMPQQADGVVYNGMLSPTRVTKNLILAILGGEVLSPESAVVWLEHRARQNE